MKTELNMEDLEAVAGGKAYIDGNTNRIAFSTTKAMYQLKNCTAIQALALVDGMRGMYATEAEFDAACLAALQAKGWV